MQSDQGLTGFDEAPNGNAAHMNIQRYAVDLAAIQGGAIQAGLIGRRMKNKNGLIKGISGAKIFKIVLELWSRISFSLTAAVNRPSSGAKTPGSTKCDTS